jgi:hypothetical protein
MKNKEQIPERLSSAGRKLPFELPESYFDDFPRRIQERIMESGKPASPVLGRKLAMAAIFIGMIAVGYAGFRILTNPGGSPYFSEEDLNRTIEYMAYELDDEMLISALPEPVPGNSSQASGLQEEDIIQYLSEEDIDFSDLIID